MSAATGNQYEINYGESQAVITEIGAGLRLFSVDGVHYTETYGADEHPPLGCGSVLVPWPNRVAGARWTWQGEPQQLDVTEEPRGNAIHGLTRHLAWKVVNHEQARIELETEIEVQAGWPVPLHTSITYALDETGLTVNHTVRNTGEAPIPFGVGVHPYPRPGHSARAHCTLHLSAATSLPLDPETMIPSGPPQPLTGTDFDFTSPLPLAGLSLDTPFGGCLPGPDGLIHHRLAGPEGGVEIWADPAFRWIQVFTADFPDRPGVIAIEPMTCPPDALNSGEDLITLAPTQSWSARWGLTPLR